MELKEYQQEALARFSRWRNALGQAQTQTEKLREKLRTVLTDSDSEHQRLLLNVPRTAWKNLSEVDDLPRAGREHIPRTDGQGRAIPHVCFKVPTGGGKTLLGAGALERLSQSTGLVLWFVPSKAIYAQTKSALWNRQHPYRQMLERASGGRVKVLEKDDRFTRDDAQHHLCVMLISLHGANRKKNKDYLRMFRDTAKYPSFFPDDDDLVAQHQMMREHPDLETVGGNRPKQSLANVFKLVRPVAVLDEAHKAYGAKKGAEEEFVGAISRFNPSLVIELSATPHAGISNLLVDIGGPALKREQMIKLPIQVRTTTDTGWRQTLTLAFDERENLEHAAVAYAEDGGRYIRPIAVVRVERTGKEQRDAGRIHAEDAREHLLALGVPADQIAIKSAEVDEVTGLDLMSPYSPVRWIITKSALMEGWDCAFAYLLVVLDNTGSKRAITQLVGRVMRQPYARRTGIASLDQCYVYCTETAVSEAMAHVKSGLEHEGLGDLSDDVSGDSPDMQVIRLSRRPALANSEIRLPRVLHRGTDGSTGAPAWIDLDYQRHILSHIDWNDIQITGTRQSLPQQPLMHYGTVDFEEQGTLTAGTGRTERLPDPSPLLSWYARRLADLAPNPWQAARVASEALKDLRAGDLSDAQIYGQRAALAESLRLEVQRQINTQSEQMFRDKLTTGEMRFSLDTSLPSHLLRADPYEIALSNAHELQPSVGTQLQLSLMVPMIEEQFDSELEKRFAFYLDGHNALKWWHRVAARQSDEYFLRGWKPERIWPDFIAMASPESGCSHLLVFELKGDHLAGSEDTEYKQKVLQVLEEAFTADSAFDDSGRDCGVMTVHNGPMRGAFRMVFDQRPFDIVDQALGLI
ncbi:DEAD/DEAH box helicase [Candidatus Poriferisodalis sp.]|uniref:DEAD/DEAH box helicase n=1 Tax=Candidatus Poriferisodalis sp. TaxID=3101277 RepID=UPI003B02C1F3